MTDLAPRLAAIRPDAPEEIPVIDVGPLLVGAPGALESLRAPMRHALETIGFYFIVGHGVQQSLIDATFAAAKAFHEQKEERKLALRLDRNNIGYMPFKGSTTRHSALNADNLPNLVEAFFVKRERAGEQAHDTRPFRGKNRWPPDLPGFRKTVLRYCEAMERLASSLLPLYAVALDMPAGFFERAFTDPMFTLRMSHYPRQDVVQDNEFGLAPHSDTSFMTLLAHNQVPGLSIRLPNGKWLEAPPVPGSFLVNGGDMLRRWTNERFLATPHRVINLSGRERYAIPFFFDCNYDWPMTCVPSCVAAGEAPRYDPITYPEYMTWFRDKNYAAAISHDGVKLSAG
jgi:isopenicillin N synthase-like dioxygenase